MLTGMLMCCTLKPCYMMLWAVVSSCLAAANSPASLLYIRFVLGFVEAPAFPGAIYTLSCWYTKKELGVQMTLLVCGILLSNSFASLISAGILDGMTGITHLASKRCLFILEGLTTIVIAVAAILYLPDYPDAMRGVTEEEKTVARARLTKDAGAEDVHEEEASLLQGLTSPTHRLLANGYNCRYIIFALLP
ncbi:major facilitator superfamily domain-containing protein [Xylariales sp. AK1849]|nr:major facilitator superfamily domain-containing protein [Xylariales sp. AK1849]